jgi:hypothetical protein
MTDGEKPPLTLQNQPVMFYEVRPWAPKDIRRESPDMA